MCSKWEKGRIPEGKGAKSSQDKTLLSFWLGEITEKKLIEDKKWFENEEESDNQLH